MSLLAVGSCGDSGRLLRVTASTAAPCVSIKTTGTAVLWSTSSYVLKFNSLHLHINTGMAAASSSSNTQTQHKVTVTLQHFITQRHTTGSIQQVPPAAPRRPSTEEGHTTTYTLRNVRPFLPPHASPSTACPPGAPTTRTTHCLTRVWARRCVRLHVPRCRMQAAQGCQGLLQDRAGLRPQAAFPRVRSAPPSPFARICPPLPTTKGRCQPGQPPQHPPPADPICAAAGPGPAAGLCRYARTPQCQRARGCAVHGRHQIRSGGSEYLSTRAHRHPCAPMDGWR